MSSSKSLSMSSIELSSLQWDDSSLELLGEVHGEGLFIQSMHLCLISATILGIFGSPGIFLYCAKHSSSFLVHPLMLFVFLLPLFSQVSAMAAESFFTSSCFFFAAFASFVFSAVSL